MTQEKLLFYSTIHPSLKRRLIYQSLLLSVPGFFLLLWMGIFCSLAVLQQWGIWGGCLAFLLISAGMIPYKRITALETRPHHIEVSQAGLRFFHSQRGEHFFSHAHLTSLTFLEKKHFYGICLHLETRKRFLLPYFSKAVFNEISTLISYNNHTK